MLCWAKASALFSCVMAGTSRPPREGGNHPATCSNILNDRDVILINLQGQESPEFSVFPFERRVAETDG